MEKAIKETTRLLSLGVLSKNDADVILIDLFKIANFVNEVTTSICKEVNLDKNAICEINNKK